MESFRKALTQLIEEHLSTSRAPYRKRSFEDAGPTVSEQARDIAETLISQALAVGFEAKVARVTPELLGEGNTAQLVARIHIPLSFIFKLDESPKLVEEARLMRRFREDDSLPKSFRDRFPRVYAIRDDAKPFAYLFEDFPESDGYQSLASRLFREPRPEFDNTEHLLHETLKALYDGYGQSANRRLLPSIKVDYLDRIRERLSEAAELDSFFISRSVNINGTDLPPWSEQLDQICSHEDQLRLISPPFLCAVHGDPNPENIMLKINGAETDVKLIDPKAWEFGDYLFDITKLAHYLWATGPVERASGGLVEVADGPSVRYSINRAPWVQPAIDLIYARTQAFAEASGDSNLMNLRWELGMASNLLGLPAGRWRNRKRDEAKIFYAEGLVWLNRFLESFSAL